MSAKFNLVQLDDDLFGYGVGRVTNNPDLVDFICDQSISWLSILCAMMSVCFPEVARVSED